MGSELGAFSPRRGRWLAPAQYLAEDKGDCCKAHPRNPSPGASIKNSIEPSSRLWVLHLCGWCPCMVASAGALAVHLGLKVRFVACARGHGHEHAKLCNSPVFSQCFVSRGLLTRGLDPMNSLWSPTFFPWALAKLGSLACGLAPPAKPHVLCSFHSRPCHVLASLHDARRATADAVP